MRIKDFYNIITNRYLLSRALAGSNSLPYTSERERTYLETGSVFMAKRKSDDQRRIEASGIDTSIHTLEGMRDSKIKPLMKHRSIKKRKRKKKK